MVGGFDRADEFHGAAIMDEADQGAAHSPRRAANDNVQHFSPG
jgi:hypothetical protein